MTGRLTGVQAALAAVVAELGRWRAQMAPREYMTLVEVLGIWIDAERRRLERSRGRWSR